MLISENLGVGSNGRLTLAGQDVRALAEQYHTPLYLMDEDEFRKNCRLYQESLRTCYGSNGLILYASKAFLCKAICRIVQEEGLGLDVVSGGELFTALSAGFPSEKIYFHGNNKTQDELELAVSNNVGCIVLDNLVEIERLNEIAGAHGKTVSVSFRIKPGIEAHTHSYIQTGQIDSKFGFALETGEALQAVKAALSCTNLRVAGVHCHIGSQIFDLQPFVQAAEVMLGFMAQVRHELGHTIGELNLGGGYGMRYTPEDTPIPYGDYMHAVSQAVERTCQELQFPHPFIVMEPGRSIAAPAGLTVYTVGGVKHIPNVRTYVSVDGGMTDSPRHILYGSKYTALLVDHPDAAPTQTITLAGKCCESGDIIAEDVPLPDVKPGDLIAVPATGAYHYSMSSNYNRIPRPPVVLVNREGSRLVVKRETYEDLLRNDL